MIPLSKEIKQGSYFFPIHQREPPQEHFGLEPAHYGVSPTLLSSLCRVFCLFCFSLIFFKYPFSSCFISITKIMKKIGNIYGALYWVFGLYSTVQKVMKTNFVLCSREISPTFRLAWNLYFGETTVNDIWPCPLPGKIDSIALGVHFFNGTPNVYVGHC